jgi:hypothetical protein
MNFPSFDERLDYLNQFIFAVVDNYHAGTINSWDALDEKVKSFFTAERMDQTEALVPGWKRMASYSDGITLTHVMCVFLGLFMLPEYKECTPEQQQLAKWIVLFHDVEKIHIRGRRDLTHGFRCAAQAGKTLINLGFEKRTEFENNFDAWNHLTNSAMIFSDSAQTEIQDNGKLSEIVSGIDQLYGKNTPAGLIIKGVLFHMSLNVIKDWPQSAPLNDIEIKIYIDRNLAPLLKLMCLADNEGWVMFYPDARVTQKLETLDAFQKFEMIINSPIPASPLSRSENTIAGS